MDVAWTSKRRRVLTGHVQISRVGPQREFTTIISLPLERKENTLSSLLFVDRRYSNLKNFSILNISVPEMWFESFSS